ncbi:HugZ family protein [Hydrocarboniphaga sp.]|uniref:HugZ family pyridoxamine 5'-phosphate oxidase n=1 Tax=Hydrocarboniphaga sp. TaxID=2033016 RepID=UPI003D0D2D27
MANNETSAAQARDFYAHRHQGILSTMSLAMPGYPFGSVATFAPDRDNRPLILISAIAEHTRNIKADARVSLTLTEGGNDSQAEARLTIIGDASRVPDSEIDEAAARYYRRFPHATDYHRAHDFSFYRIQALRGRYIGGFGRIHWVEGAALNAPNPFSEQDEAGMIDHMNRDHADAMLAYCRLFDIDVGAQTPRLSAIDGEGFDLMLGHRVARIAFDSPVQTPTDVRKAMVALVQRARSATSR